MEVCRKLGVSEQTFYRWTRRSAGMGVVELRRLRQEDALLRVARPMIDSSHVVAIGRFLRVVNVCEVDRGRLVRVRTPRQPLATFQIVEYLQGFLAGRTGYSALNCLLIISGAFGMFHRQDFIKAGG